MSDKYMQLISNDFSLGKCGKMWKIQSFFLADMARLGK